MGGECEQVFARRTVPSSTTERFSPLSAHTDLSRESDLSTVGRRTSRRTMETQTKNNDGQLISVPHKDTIRLLEVYVKRSISLNDGTVAHESIGRKEKWVTHPRRHRRHSSDPSLHLTMGTDDMGICTLSVIEDPTNQPETLPEEPEKPAKKPKKNKKPSFWKNFLSIFSRKSNEEKDEEQNGPSETPEAFQAEGASDAATPCLPTTPLSLPKKSMRRKSIRRRFSKRRLSLTKTNRSGKDLNAADITRVEAAVSVESTYSYYEKFSEELEKIVHEVKEKEEAKPLSDEEVINRIIALTKQQGDAIEDKMKDNPTLSSFFQGMTYSSFQKLADAYLEKEASPTHNPPTVPTTAPELVKLAFVLDFTARIASLSKQNVGHITGLGNLYLRDRFKYKQACTDHPWSDSDD